MIPGVGKEIEVVIKRSEGGSARDPRLGCPGYDDQAESVRQYDMDYFIKEALR